MTRKYIALLLAVICLLSVSALAAGNEQDENPLPFDDVSEAAWYYDAVQYVTDNDLMRGFTVTDFRPEEKITLGQYLTVLYRMGIGLDVPYPVLATSGADWLAAARYLAGEDATENALQAPATREEMAHFGTAFLQTVCQALDADAVVSRQAAFADADAVDPRYRDDVDWFYGVGAISGYTDGTFRPQAEVRRCEAARVFYNLLNAVTLVPSNTDAAPADDAAAAPAA